VEIAPFGGRGFMIWCFFGSVHLKGFFPIHTVHDVLVRLVIVRVASLTAFQCSDIGGGCVWIVDELLVLTLMQLAACLWVSFGNLG